MLENILKVRLDVSKKPSNNLDTNYAILNKHIASVNKRTIIFNFPKRLKNRNITFFIQSDAEGKLEEIYTGTTSKSGKIKISTKSEIGKVFLTNIEDEEKNIYWK